METISSSQQVRTAGTNSTTPRVAIVADLLEEGWPSMDLTAEMLSRPPTADADGQRVLIRPPMRRRWSRTNQKGGAGFTADRLLNRFHDYPRHLRALREQFDLFHLTDHSYSQLIHEVPAERTVVTCHDLDTFRCLWESAGSRRSWWFRAMTRRILTGMQKAAHVCCDSEATRNGLLARALLPPERTSVVPLGLRPELTAPPNPAVEARVDALLSAPPGATKGSVNLLHVGSTIPRKRIDVLLEVFARIKRDVEPRARLLRAGGRFTTAQQAQAQRLGLVDSILVLPFLSAAELASVYRRATLVFVPSEAEGFGLPVIEALAAGTPVLASDLPVLREVGGEAANYAPVADIDAWTERVGELLAERRSAPERWEARRECCRRQGTRFSWDETARQTAVIYHRILATL